LTEENNVLKSEIYKEIDEKREDVYYRINNLINHDLITFSETSDKTLCINSNVKENVDEILKTFKIYTEKNKFSKEEEV